MNFKRKEFIDFLILLFGALILYYLLVTNKVILFLNPRMNKYILFTFVVFIALCINQFLNAFSIDSLKWIKGGVIAFFGILILFTYPIYKVHMDNKRVQKEINAEKKYEKDNFNEIYKLKEENKIKSENYNKDDDSLILNEDNYMSLYQEIMINPDSYKGKKITTEGFIFKEKGFKEGEFVIGRELMTCCAADTQVVGLLCDYKSLSNFKEGDWVSVEGTINVIDNKPIIEVKTVLKTDKVGSKYIYSK